MISEELNTVLLLLTVILVKHLAYGVAAAGPIEKHPGSIIKPPSVMHIPEVVEESYVFGGTNAPDIGGNGGDYMNRRDVVCNSEANSGCHQRCIALKQNCLCGSNGKTYRNQCEMSCMRKVEMSTINWSHFGRCRSPCPIDRQMRYKKMLKDLLMTRYLRLKVRRCGKLANCAQAKLVMEYTEGEQSILECYEHLSPFLLFLDLKCPDYAAIQLQRILDNEAVIDCSAVKVVNNKLFNDRNCGRQKKGLSEKELIMWAFEEFDSDGDWQLKESELSILSVIPDSACNETLFSGCDTNQDGFVRGDEWSLCLGCSDCYKPCHVYNLERKKKDRKRRLVTSVVKCNQDGSCASKQCENNHGNHLQCWCVDRECRETEGTRSYTARNCS